MEPKTYRLLALDLDGTLLNSQKELSPRNRRALEKAHEKGVLIVPTTGRFYGGMPQVIRELPFVRYCITINGAQVMDLWENKVLYRAEIPCAQAVEIMSWLDGYPALYDCYQQNESFMTARLREQAMETIEDIHFRNMVRDLRQPVPELKAFLLERGRDLQKIQFFIQDQPLRRWLMEELPRRFADLSVTSSVRENVEINHKDAHKGAALTALAKYLGFGKEAVIAFGDGENDISMLREAGLGVAMENACPQALAAADYITASCDEDGVAQAMEKFILN